jgi:hypothetical protein
MQRQFMIIFNNSGRNFTTQKNVDQSQEFMVFFVKCKKKWKVEKPPMFVTSKNNSWIFSTHDPKCHL